MAWRGIHPRMAVAFGLVAFVVLYFSPSLAAWVAFCVAICVFGIVYIRPRSAIYAIAGLFVVAVAASPLLPLHVVAPDKLVTIMGDLPQSWQHRLYIWEFVAERIAEKPLSGWGFDASRDMIGRSNLAAGFFIVLPLHPHNAALQWWVELGFPGVAIVLVLLTYIFFSLARAGLDRARIAMAAAMISAYLVIANISYGVWQNWWLAVAWMMGAYFLAIMGPIGESAATPRDAEGDPMLPQA